MSPLVLLIIPLLQVVTHPLADLGGTVDPPSMWCPVQDSPIAFVEDAPGVEDVSPLEGKEGDRIARVLGFDPQDFRRLFSRGSLFDDYGSRPWGGMPPMDLWRAAGQSLLEVVTPEVRMIFVLGRWAALALGMPGPLTVPKREHSPRSGTRWRVGDRVFVYLPSASWQAPDWSKQEYGDLARGILYPELVRIDDRIRPWHFRLGEDARVLRDLGVSLCPHTPRIGSAVALRARALGQATKARKTVKLLSLLDDGELDPWDIPLREIVRMLTQPQGARVVAEAWGEAENEIKQIANDLPSEFDLKAAAQVAAFYEASGVT